MSIRLALLITLCVIFPPFVLIVALKSIHQNVTIDEHSSADLTKE